jgi:hypothetical protein
MNHLLRVATESTAIDSPMIQVNVAGRFLG